MFQSNLYWIFTVLILLVLMGYLWYTRHPSVEGPAEDIRWTAKR